MLTKDQITELYIAMFQRAPSESEIDYWYNTAQSSNLDVVSLADTMVNAARDAVHMFGLEDLYPQYASYDPNNPDSIKAIVESVYSTIFNKDATEDPDGINYWTNEVLNGKSLGEVIVAIENAAKDIAENPDKYKNIFDEETLNQAIEATKAFESKVNAAKDIASQISNVKVDADSLKEMQDIIKNVKDDNDITSIMEEITIIKEKVEVNDLAGQNSNAGDMDVDDEIEGQDVSGIDIKETYAEDYNSIDNFNSSSIEELIQDYQDNENQNSECENKLENVKAQLDSLSPEQIVSLNNELNTFANDYLTKALSDGEYSSDEQAEYQAGIEDIYAKYGVDIASLYDCGVLS